MVLLTTYYPTPGSLSLTTFACKQGLRPIRSWGSEDKMEAIHLWEALGFGPCPATTYLKGQEVNGYFVAKFL